MKHFVKDIGYARNLKYLGNKVVVIVLETILMLEGEVLRAYVFVTNCIMY